MPQRFGAEYDFNIPSMFNLSGVHLPSYTEISHPPLTPNKIEISVVAPLYNRAPILESSLKSYLWQEFPKNNYEIILVDDASDDNTKEIVEQICKKYPDFNIRCYFLDHTRCYNNVHPSNVGYRESLGGIIMNTHMDVILASPHVFEAAWRHQNRKPNLWMNPKTHGVLSEHHQQAEKLINEARYTEVLQYSISSDKAFRPPGYPNEFGACVPKYYIEKIQGNDERIIGNPADVDQWLRLQRSGLVFGQDETVQTVHRCYARMRPPPFDPKQRMAELGFIWNPDEMIKNKDGKWGLITQKERENTVMTETMRRTLK